MIQYSVTPEAPHDPLTLDVLKERITKKSKKWFERAEAALAALPEEPKSSDFQGIWSDIKEVYETLQHSKCAFCEQKLEGAINEDVEHFRPKAEVAYWQAPQDLLDAGLPLEQWAGYTEWGYRFLAYHPLNYAVSCKYCNSTLKGNLFPIAGTRETEATEPPGHVTEKSYLIYPIGAIDDKPEDLIEFVGCVPQPVATSGHKRFRAQVTIAIFKLADPNERRVFYEGRAKQIQLLYLNLVAAADNTDAVLSNLAQRNVNRMLKDSEEFANCLRCFEKLFRRSRPEADSVFRDLTEFLDSVSP